MLSYITPDVSGELLTTALIKCIVLRQICMFNIAYSLDILKRDCLYYFELRLSFTQL